jgi:hypothetical protein
VSWQAKPKTASSIATATPFAPRLFLSRSHGNWIARLRTMVPSGRFVYVPPAVPMQKKCDGLASSTIRVKNFRIGRRGWPLTVLTVLVHVQLGLHHEGTFLVPTFVVQ